MAKVTITVEDREKNGEDGLRISVDSDPKFPEDDMDCTLAQTWALEIVNLIVENANEITTVDKSEVDISKLN